MNLGFRSFLYVSFDYVRMRFLFYFVEEKCVCAIVSLLLLFRIYSGHMNTHHFHLNAWTLSLLLLTFTHTHPLTSAISIGSMVMRWNHLDFIYDCCCLSPIDELTSWWPLGHDSQSRNSFGLENVQFLFFFVVRVLVSVFFCECFRCAQAHRGHHSPLERKNEKKANVVDSDVHVVNASISVFVLLLFNVSLFTFQFIAHHHLTNTWACSAYDHTLILSLNMITHKKRKQKKIRFVETHRKIENIVFSPPRTGGLFVRSAAAVTAVCWNPFSSVLASVDRAKTCIIWTDA